MLNKNRLITYLVNEDGKRIQLTVEPKQDLHPKVRVILKSPEETRELVMTVQEALHINVLLDKLLISKF